MIEYIDKGLIRWIAWRERRHTKDRAKEKRVMPRI